MKNIESLFKELLLKWAICIGGKDPTITFPIELVKNTEDIRLLRFISEKFPDFNSFSQVAILPDSDMMAIQGEKVFKYHLGKGNLFYFLSLLIRAKIDIWVMDDTFGEVRIAFDGEDDLATNYRKLFEAYSERTCQRRAEVKEAFGKTAKSLIVAKRASSKWKDIVERARQRRSVIPKLKLEANMQHFIQFIRLLQDEWFNMMLVMGMNEEFSKTIESTCSARFRTDFQNIFRCGATADFLWYIFFNEQTPSFSRSDKEQLWESNREYLDEMIRFTNTGFTFYYIAIAGPSNYDRYGNQTLHLYMPDHAFIIVRAGTRFYLLQGYYYAYTFASEKYGFRDVTDSLEDLIMWLSIYNNVFDFTEKTITPYFENLLKENDDRYIKYTGINFNQYERDRKNKPSFGIYKKNVESSDFHTFIDNIQDRLCNNMSIILKEKKYSYSLGKKGYTYSIKLQNAYAGETISGTPNNMIQKLVFLAGLRSDLSAYIQFKDLSTKEYRDKIESFTLDFTVDYHIIDIIRRELAKAFHCETQ